MGRAEEIVADVLLMMTDALRLMNAKSDQAINEARQTNDLLGAINKTLATISVQNADIREEVGRMVERQNTHERAQRESTGKIRAVEATLSRHEAAISELRQAAGR